MNAVRIRARLANGDLLVGPVRGIGGMLGNSSLFAGGTAAGEAALNQIGRAQMLAEQGWDSALFEPVPRHVALFPDYCAASDGDYVAVPLVGTRFEV